MAFVEWQKATKSNSSSFSYSIFGLVMVIVLILLLFASTSYAATTDTLSLTSSLSVEKPNDTLVSPNGDFSAGFFKVGDNAYCFSVWFTRSKQPTPVWMANRDEPVNGKASKLSLLRTGNLVLIDAGKTTFWSTGTFSPNVQLKLRNNGNLILSTIQEGTVLWQSFDSPTDTILPGQQLTVQAFPVSSRSTTNYSTGFYKLFFDTDNVLRLLYKGPTVSSVYWPTPYLLPASNGRSTFNLTRVAVLDPYGNFTSSDGFQIKSTDYGKRLHRRMVVDPDGNLRIYSFNEALLEWEVAWQVISETCTIHGLCGANSMCAYHPVIGRTCFCIQGFKMKNPNDWTEGCEPEFNLVDLSCKRNVSLGFLPILEVEFYGYENNVYNVASLTECQAICLNRCKDCMGVQLSFNQIQAYNCYPKTVMLNGRNSPDFSGDTYVKLPESTLLSSKKPSKHSPMQCSPDLSQPLKRFYQNPRKNSTLNFLVWFAAGVGVLELSTFFLVWFFLFRTQKKRDGGDQHHKILSATGFQKFTYAELKKATKKFNHEIGRGAGGIVYKGTLDDGDRIAAVKCLSETNIQGEAEFLAEISTIGMLNHMNLIDMWGYCVEGKHRILVYEYMEHGSLADNLRSNSLDWKKRFNIAVGTAKGLAYLHEECLEWVLHCDVKPQNILLDSDFQPKVADFGLSKLLNRDERDSSGGFSRIRGTRGYMAPEWVYNLRITSKVDVYSYGIVVLEMVTGKSPMEVHSLDHSGEIEQRRLVTWVKEIMNSAPRREFWVEAIADPKLEGQYDISQVEVLVKVALQCVQDDMNERPSMSQVAEMLQPHGNTLSIW